MSAPTDRRDRIRAAVERFEQRRTGRYHSVIRTLELAGLDPEHGGRWTDDDLEREAWRPRNLSEDS